MKSHTNNSQFSFFKGPITNLIPLTQVQIPDIYRGITSNYYRNTVEVIRSTSNPETKRKAKAKLDYVTFAGIFNKRDAQSIVSASGYTCIDLDHIKNNELLSIKEKLIEDKMFETQLLFISPSGHGLKWVIEIDLNNFNYGINFLGVIGYLKRVHHLDDYIDTKVKDLSRACFMSHDPAAFIHPKYLK